MKKKIAIILSGGLGTRLQPFTNIMPKPLLPVGEKAVLEIQIEQLAKHGFTDVYLATNYKSEYIEKFFGSGEAYGINLNISKEKKPLGTVGPIKLIEDELDEPFLVMNGDILTNLNFDELFRFGHTQKSKLTVTVKQVITPFRFGNIGFDGDLVTSIEEKPNIVTYALGGIYFMRPEILGQIPKDEMYNMDQLMIQMIKSNDPISKYEIIDYWLDIGYDEDYKKAQELFK